MLSIFNTHTRRREKVFLKKLIVIYIQKGLTRDDNFAPPYLTHPSPRGFSPPRKAGGTGMRQDFSPTPRDGAGMGLDFLDPPRPALLGPRPAPR